MKTVELDGVRYQVPDDASLDEIDSFIKAKQGGSNEPSPSMTKTAAPVAEPPYDPSFTGTFTREVSGGAEDIASGVSRVMQFSKPGSTGMGMLDIGTGAARIVGAFPAATGSAVGEFVGESVRSATEDLGPNISALLGTAAGAPVNLATQVWALPKTIAMAAPLATKVTQAMARGLPGAQVALRDIGRKVVEAMPDLMRPKIASDTIFAELRQLNPKTPLPLFAKAAKKIVKTETELGEFGLANTGLKSTASQTVSGATEKVNAAAKWLGDEFGITPATQLKDIPFDIGMKIRQRLGARIGDLRRNGGEELGSYKQLFRNLSEDFEKAADLNTGQAFKKLKEANAAANREFALGELDDIFNATMGRALEGRNFESSNFAQALNKVRDLRRSDELFAKGMGAKNLDKIESRLNELRELKIPPPPKGGSMLLGRQIGVAGGLGTAIGAYMGGGTGAMIGGGIGGAVGAGVPAIISKVIQSEKGTRALTKLLKSEGTVSPKKMIAIFALVQGEAAVKTKLEDQVRSMLKTPEVSLQDKIAAALNKDTIFKMTTEAEALLKQ